MEEIDRTEFTEDIFEILKRLAEQDIRIGQAISNASSKTKTDLFYIENEDLLALLTK